MSSSRGRLYYLFHVVNQLQLEKANLINNEKRRMKEIFESHLRIEPIAYVYPHATHQNEMEWNAKIKKKMNKELH